MKKRLFVMFIAMISILAACGDDDNDDEVKMLDVNDDATPETVTVDEPFQFEVTVTYGGDKVPDADDVVFEYWEKGNKDNSTRINATNNEDGTYTAEVTFDEPGEYEMYSHVDAEGLHTMPKKSVKVEK